MAILLSKSLIEKHAALVAEFERLKIDFSGVTARLGSAQAAQRALDEIGMRIIALEREHGVDEARRINEHEATFLPDLPTFQALARDYAPRPDDAKNLAAGLLTDEQLEQRAEIVRGAKEALARIARVASDSGARRKKLSKEAIALAAEPDSLSDYERENFERLYADSRGQHVASARLQQILQPV